MHRHISPETLLLLKDCESKLEKKGVLLDKKIASLQKDLKEAKSAKLSAKTTSLIALEISEQKEFKKHIMSEGVVDLLSPLRDKALKNQASLGKKVITAIDQLIKKGLNQTVLNALQQTSQSIDQFNSQEKVLEKKLIEHYGKMDKKTKRKSLPYQIELLSSIDQYNNQRVFFQSILDQLSSLQVLQKDDLKVSNAFPLKTTRAPLAQKCIESSRSELSGAWGFLEEGDDLSMLAMFVSDAFNHYNLGVEILHGDPKKIDKASSMDTASRDGIDEDVWDFVSIKIYDKDIFGPKTLLAHQQKVKEQEAKKLKNTMKKHIGDTTGKRSSLTKKM